jgi:hypothetical protein
MQCNMITRAEKSECVTRQSSNLTGAIKFELWVTTRAK